MNKVIIILLSSLFCGSVFAVPDKTIPQSQVFDVPQFSSCGAFGCTSSTLAIAVGTVVEVSGSAQIIHANGTVYQLGIGDAMFRGETIVTGPTGHVCFTTGWTKTCVGPLEKYKL